MDTHRLRALLENFRHVTVLVVGDFFLDKYLDIDPQWSEPSLETGLEAYQVRAVRRYPGAAGTVVNNLRALGVNVLALGVIGDDGEGDDLIRGLGQMGVPGNDLIRGADRFTPTYLKPMLLQQNAPARELNRLDTKNRTPLPDRLETEVIDRLHRLLPQVQGVVIADQVSEPECGVITRNVRAALSELAQVHPAVTLIADSRERIGQFRNVLLKPNAREAARATGHPTLTLAGQELYRRAQRPVAITHSEQGIFLFDEAGERRIPAVPVSGPIDVVGAGDSAMSGLVSTLCAGGTLDEAALVGNLVASITVQQLGVTGTATPEQVLARFAAGEHGLLEKTD